MLEEDLRRKYLRCRSVTDLRQLDGSRLANDLRRYMNLAEELSVTSSSIVKRKDFLIDRKARMKCRIPVCRYYGTSLNCPPHTSHFDEIQKTINGYQTGILLGWEFPRQNVLEDTSNLRRSIYKTISIIESAAFYDGYYFACGFATGSCRRSLCNNLDCQALTSPEKGCRNPLLARPSMEAVGFDVYGMAAHAGWKLFPALL